MKNVKDKRVLQTGWFKKNVSEKEIQAAANEMKNNKAYLFIDAEGFLHIYCKRRLNEYEAKGKKFIRKIPVTK
mgnify:CR=1 FL=1